MRCLTLTEPWATLIALGEKRIETRSWATCYRGPLAIHAGKRMTQDDLAVSQSGPISAALRRHGIYPGRWWHRTKDAFPATRGRILAVCRLEVCLPTGNAIVTGWLGSGREQRQLPFDERPFGDYSPNRFAWVLSEVLALPEPIPAIGQLGVWEWEPPDGWEMPR